MLLLTFMAADLRAQVRLPDATPTVPSITVPAVPNASGQIDRVRRVVDPGDLLAVRQLAVRDLLTRHAAAVEADPRGAPATRGEVVAISPSPAALSAASAAGFEVSREIELAALGERALVLRAPAGMSTAAALARLRELDPTGTYDYNHLFVRSGAASGRPAAVPRTAAARGAPGANARVGLIDGGVDVRHPALRHASVRQLECPDGGVVPSEHGTAVASLLVGRARRFAGAAPDATLYAADVYCGLPAGGALTQLLRALGWLAGERVTVINVSLVGPPNAVLGRVVRALSDRGHLLVAAVGNDGPASPPLYPAGYAADVTGVIAVTGVDARRRVLPEAVRGAHVVFSAPGADLLVAANGSETYVGARGTSFAAPFVAGLLAVAVGRTGDAADGGAQQAARRAVDDLVSRALDLGAAGRDPTFGFGLVGQDLRVDPVSQR